MLVQRDAPGQDGKCDGYARSNGLKRIGADGLGRKAPRQKNEKKNRTKSHGHDRGLHAASYPRAMFGTREISQDWEFVYLGGGKDEADTEAPFQGLYRQRCGMQIGYRGRQRKPQTVTGRAPAGFAPV
jgi:hypothetical protein